MLLLTKLTSCKNLLKHRPFLVNKLHRTELYTLTSIMVNPATSAVNPPSSLRQRAVPLSQTTILKPLDHHVAGHAHAEDARSEAAALLAAIRGGTSRGSRITLIGLGSNLALTGVKGTAGVLLGSAALLADAFHSGSDLLADIVTLATFRISREPSDLLHPYGYGKYECLGSLLVSFLLIGTALGIGFHSYQLLLTTLPTLPVDLSFLHYLGAAIPQSLSTDEIEEIADARAMWFAAASVLIKEYLYRITLRVAKEEHSNVLLANALHHRSDALSSLVVLGAIAGAWLGYPVLDPLGGLLVTAAILHNGTSVGLAALKELVDRNTDETLAAKIHSLLLSLRDPSLPSLPPFDSSSSAAITEITAESSSKLHPALPILAITSVRIFASGPSLFVDLELVLPKELVLSEVTRIQETIKRACEEEMGGKARVREVRIVVKGE